MYDAYCGWCYGFGPAFAALVGHVGDRAEIRVVNGGHQAREQLIRQFDSALVAAA